MFGYECMKTQINHGAFSLTTSWIKMRLVFSRATWKGENQVVHVPPCWVHGVSMMLDMDMQVDWCHVVNMVSWPHERGLNNVVGTDHPWYQLHIINIIIINFHMSLVWKRYLSSSMLNLSPPPPPPLCIVTVLYPMWSPYYSGHIHLIQALGLDVIPRLSYPIK